MSWSPSIPVVLVMAAACSASSTPAAPAAPPPMPPERVPHDALVEATEPQPPAEPAVVGAPVDAGPAAPTPLPKRCAADSPVDDPCSTYGGTYRVTLRPRDGEHCVLTRPAEARITISGANAYAGVGQASELAPLARAIGKPASELRIGADVRDGVCCIDLEVSPRGVDAFVRVKMARGAKVISAKAKERRMTGNKMCDAELEVRVELVAE